ncbi:MAG TPA: hypothetical protein VFD32_04610 [Dehalococcoidia bacterium]|nr:hypothetical protein [Dehalococcoidia bacterium]
MADNRDEQALSTADMAAAAERRQNAPSTTAAVSEAQTPQMQQMPGDGASVSQAAGAPAAENGEQRARLLDGSLTDELRRRWTDVQASFVDEPRQAVKQADGLVAEVMKQLAETFAQERSHLEQQWDRGGDVSTEDLRVALRRYRSFFERLLST